MARFLKFFGAASAVILFLSGCAQSNPAVQYVANQDLSVLNGATIVGSRLETSGLTHILMANQDTFLGAVDGRYVVGPSPRWSNKVLIAPGQHVLDIAVCECHNIPLLTVPVRGEADFQVNLLPGVVYTLHSAMPQAGWPQWKVDVWITDGTGRTVAEPQKVALYRF